MSIKGWLGKENTVYSYHGILSSQKKEVLINATTWMNPENIVMWYKPNTKSHILYDDFF